MTQRRLAALALLWMLATTCACARGVRGREAQRGGAWVATWTASPQPAIAGKAERFANQTLRLVVHPSLGGSRVRVRVANVFADRPLRVGAAHVARRASEAAIDPASDRALTFDGGASTLVPPHAIATSDPVDLDVRPFADLAVSLYLPDAIEATTTHVLALQTSYASPPIGDATGAASFPIGKTIESWPFLAGVDVEAAPGARAVVVFGDSVVDGDGSTSDANRRWTDALAARLGGSGLAVVNEGIIGNRLLRDSPLGKENPLGPVFGPSALARFDRDVLGQSGVDTVVIRIGTNDLGFPGAFAPEGDAVTVEAMIAGYRTLIARARGRGLRVVGATVSPFKGAEIAKGYWTEEKERVRRGVNEWMRAAKELDGVIDSDAVLRDPGDAERIAGRFDSGDHLHPNDAGYEAMGEAGGRVIEDLARAPSLTARTSASRE